MMEAVFLHLLNMSITAGWLVLAVLLLRLVFRRAPKWIHCLLWVMVALRLIFPVSIESVLSVIPSAQTVPVDTFLYDTPTIQSGLPAVDGVVNPMLSDSFAPQPMDSVNPMQVVSAVAANLWVLGMAAMALYAIISTVRLHRRVRESVRLRDNIFQCDRIATPFILGIIRPRIYLPTTLSEDDRLSVVAHELAHIRRRDHWWKPLGFLLLTVYWFHPLLWLGYVLLCRDIEAACDQRVIRDMDVPLRKAYSETLLACSAPRHLISACPLAFGETGVKSRIKSVLNYKKPAFWLIIVAVVATIVAAVCLLTNPKPVVSDELDAYLTHVILEQNYSEEHTGDAYPTEAHTVFGTRKKDGKLTVYAMVLYEEYYLDDLGELQVQSGSHIPAAITVDMEGSAYSLVEYWIPGDGTHYLPDMKEKFPFIYRIQVDAAKYYDIHQPRTLAAAKAHFGRNDEPAADAVVTKQNTWQTLSHPMPYEEASKVSGGRSLEKHNLKKLKEFLGELEWRSDVTSTAEQLFDAYFTLDGNTRYYVSLEAWGNSGYLYDGKQYAVLPEEQLGSWDFLLADGGSTIKPTHTFYGYFAEWNKNARCYVLDVVQADDATLVGKKIRVNTQNLYGSGLPYLGALLKASYDGTVLGDTVYAQDLAAPPEEELPKKDTSAITQSGTITGKVIYVMDDAVLLNCYNKEQFDVVWVRYNASPQLTPQLNEEYQIGFNGQTMETYPPQITAQTMTRVSSTPLNNGYISEEEAIKIAVERWNVNLDEPDMLNGYYATVYVMEGPTAENPCYKLGYRKVDTLDGKPGNSMLYYTMEIDAVTGEVLADSYMP